LVLRSTRKLSVTFVRFFVRPSNYSDITSYLPYICALDTLEIPLRCFNFGTDKPQYQRLEFRQGRLAILSLGALLLELQR
jgi:hypothetical protein